VGLGSVGMAQVYGEWRGGPPGERGDCHRAVAPGTVAVGCL
jgi:hypothetical protein